MAHAWSHPTLARGRRLGGQLCRARAAKQAECMHHSPRVRPRAANDAPFSSAMALNPGGLSADRPECRSTVVAVNRWPGSEGSDLRS